MNEEGEETCVCVTKALNPSLTHSPDRGVQYEGGIFGMISALRFRSLKCEQPINQLDGWTNAIDPTS